MLSYFSQFVGIILVSPLSFQRRMEAGIRMDAGMLVSLFGQGWDLCITFLNFVSSADLNIGCGKTKVTEITNLLRKLNM